MGKRIAPEQQAAAAGSSIRKRKRVCNDFQQPDTKNDRQKWDEETTTTTTSSSPKSPPPPETKTKQLAILNASFDDNSPKPVYHLRPSVVNGILLEDITEKKWRIGKPIGKGNFGEIFLASDNISVPVTSDNAEYVVKIEPHSNGPLFVEIHCLLNAGKKNGDNPLPPGMPEYIASGSHYFGDTRYRFLVIKRFDRDLHSLIKNRRITQKSVLTLALQILDVLQHLHDKGYCHNDIKAQNLMISNCTYRKSQLIYGNTHIDDEIIDKVEKKVKTSSGSDLSDADSGNSSNDEEYEEQKSDEEGNDQEEDEEDEDDDDEEEEEQDMYKTPVNKKNRAKAVVQYSGSNPVRSCRRDKRNSIYEEMVKSHYLRPAKRICYSEFFNEDNSKDATDAEGTSKRQQIRSSARKTASAMKQNRKRFVSESSEEENEDDDEEVSEKGAADDDDEIITEERVHLIDFGLASKFIDKDVHRPFVMDQRRAHDGTLEFTSRDAHMGAHSRRSDLECLGYNLVYWSQGYLPWRDAAAQHQNEKVHWVKEYLMKDVKEMMKHIYGKQVPKYLGEYLQYVGQLAYHERPDYDKCRRIFLREYIALGYKPNEMRLSTEELIKTSVKVKEEIENNNVIEMKNIKSIMKNLNVIMPFHESTLSNRVSPKNLRSKSAKKKTSRKKFSWTEILSQDPDQIARDRAEKEFDREPIVETPLIRYEGKPTYAILEIQNRLKLKDRIAAYVAEDGDSDNDDEPPPVVPTKAYSVKKQRSSALPVINEVTATRVGTSVTESNNKAAGGAGAPSARSTRTKAGLKTVIATTTATPSIANTTSTKRGTDTNVTHNTTNNTPITTENKRQRRTRRCLIKTGSTGDFTTTDESSCSSINSNTISINTNNHQTAVVKIKGITKQTMPRVVKGRRRKANRSDRCSSTDRSSNNSSNVNSEDDTSNFSDHANLFSPKKKRGTAKKQNNKIIHSAKEVSSPPCLAASNEDDVVGAKRRKRSIPKKRKSSTKDDCFDGEMLEERDLRTFKKRACRG